jgi:hypothetical protein
MGCALDQLLEEATWNGQLRLKVILMRSNVPPSTLRMCGLSREKFLASCIHGIGPDVANSDHCEPAPTSVPWRMNGKWPGNSSLLGSSSLVNQGE